MTGKKTDDCRVVQTLHVIAAMFMLITSGCAPVEKQTGDPLLTSDVLSERARKTVESDDAVQLKKLFAEGLNLEAKDDYGCTLLHYAANVTGGKCLQLLLDQGADIEVKSDYGATPLGEALVYDRVSNAKALLEHGADLANVGTSNLSPLILAVNNNSSEMTQLLIQRGEDPFKIDVPLSPAFHHAASMDSVGPLTVIIQYAKRAGVLDMVNKEEYTALHMAGRGGAVKSMNVLLDAGASPEILSPIGDNALTYAAATDSVALVKRLLNEGMNINHATGLGETPLHNAARGGHSEVVRLLIRGGAQIAQDSRGNTPLHYAAMSGDLRSVEYLLENGANVEVLNNRLQTPLDLAATDEIRGVLLDVKEGK